MTMLQATEQRLIALSLCPLSSTSRLMVTIMCYETIMTILEQIIESTCAKLHDGFLCITKPFELIQFIPKFFFNLKTNVCAFSQERLLHKLGIMHQPCSTNSIE